MDSQRLRACTGLYRLSCKNWEKCTHGPIPSPEATSSWQPLANENSVFSQAVSLGDKLLLRAGCMPSRRCQQATNSAASLEVPCPSHVYFYFYFIYIHFSSLFTPQVLCIYTYIYDSTQFRIPMGFLSILGLCICTCFMSLLSALFLFWFVLVQSISFCLLLLLCLFSCPHPTAERFNTVTCAAVCPSWNVLPSLLPGSWSATCWLQEMVLFILTDP